ncbi:hypothetical protein NYR77_02450 [Actinobacillus equuli subsp. haemolyticus]|uniref:hypothetical protein n=1 Tax=Actinobacillus equuli TaxID=718 RepID=UPI00244267F5|nr:hypothetical protein [Actinobacillus equuli]WGE53991.1 hypothetical protein NYR69_05375 [Actinobacillus equuli subsp. haemolyticus]WGE67911.1 hypothetical protein NYR77_02450 [Actinobacillus equuli subsp. haemolyticus]WGE72379.1 hypothetical protein NYR80_05375 [Actinobacillus equuli subsp. haemolyticus]
MLKKLLLFTIVLCSSCSYVDKWLFMAKNPDVYFFSIKDAVNAEIEIERSGMQEIYEKINTKSPIPRYIKIAPKESDKYGTVKRGLLTPEQFRYYVPHVVNNLKQTKFYTQFDRKKVTLEKYDFPPFSYGYLWVLKTIETKADDVKLLYIDDNKAHILIR